MDIKGREAPTEAELAFMEQLRRTMDPRFSSSIASWTSNGAKRQQGCRSFVRGTLDLILLLFLRHRDVV